MNLDKSNTSKTTNNWQIGKSIWGQKLLPHQSSIGLKRESVQSKNLNLQLKINVEHKPGKFRCRERNASTNSVSVKDKPNVKGPMRVVKNADSAMTNSGIHCLSGDVEEDAYLSKSQQRSERCDALGKNRTTVVSRINLNAISSIYDKVNAGDG